MIVIYGLYCPIANAIRYVGKSTQPEKRLRAHIGTALRGAYSHHTARWIRNLARSGLAPSLVILQGVLERENWRDVERAWIRKALSDGWPLTNTTAGGEGLDYLDPVAQAAHRENHRRAMKNLASTDRGRDCIRKMVVAGQTPEVRKRRTASIRKAYESDDFRKKISDASKQFHKRPGVIQKKSDAMKESWARDREKFMATTHSQEARRKHSESFKETWKKPGFRENNIKSRWTPEARQKQAQQIRSRMARMVPSPEGRERQRQAMREIWARRKAAAN